LAQIEGCKHSLTITVPTEDVKVETERALESIRSKVKLKGFRPGKVPAQLVRSRYEEAIRQEAAERLIPRYLGKKLEEENLRAVGTPTISDLHFDDQGRMEFKAEFEVVPEIELKDYRGLTVRYQDPEVTAEDVQARLEELRTEKAQYVNLDPRPAEEGDYVVVSLESLSGIEGPPVKQDEMVMRLGDPETLAAFSENLRGLTPGEQREFDVAYPEDFGQPRLAGRTVRFRARLLGLRRKELPELSDELAQDVGDYRDLDELREALRKSIYAERQYRAQLLAKSELLDRLVDVHDFPVPEVFVERQIENIVAANLGALANQGVDPKSVRLDWSKARQVHREKAEREVKGALLIDRISDREAIAATREEVDQEVHRIAKRERQPVAAVRMRLEKEGALGRIANRIQHEKTLNFLFENARKVAAE